MTTYAIGDLQGCLEPLQRLLDKLRFDPASDTLWFAGDLINRGPQSLETLRFVRQLGDLAISVLGNHDVHLLSVRAGVRKPSAKDTLDDILRAPDLEELCDWLRHRPLLHHDAQLGFTMAHAGLHPQWDLHTASQLANELHQQLIADNYLDFIRLMHGNLPDQWQADMQDADRQRFALNCFTRMRYLDNSGKLDFECNGPPGTATPGLMPWFEYLPRMNESISIVFGHWASLGAVTQAHIHPLDKGCVWGQCLAAMALETCKITEVSCAAKRG